jgi:hypothetical protein
VNIPRLATDTFQQFCRQAHFQVQPLDARPLVNELLKPDESGGPLGLSLRPAASPAFFGMEDYPSLTMGGSTCWVMGRKWKCG